MTPAETLAAFTPATGALFPFAVIEVASLDKWEPTSRCIAICDGEYRINEADADNIVGRMLVQAINDLVGDQLQPWKLTETKQIKKSNKPDPA